MQNNKNRNYSVIIAAIGILATSIVSIIAIQNNNSLNQKSWDQQIFNSSYTELTGSIWLFNISIQNKEPELAKSQLGNIMGSYQILSHVLDKKYIEKHNINSLLLAYEIGHFLNKFNDKNWLDKNNKSDQTFNPKLLQYITVELGENLKESINNK